MSLNIDVAIVVGFLIVNLLAGIYSGRGIKTIKEYAIGNRNFSTATIAATLIATWIGGGFFAIGVSQTYQDGLFFIIASMGDVLAFLIVAYIFAQHMHEFLGKLSLADVMGELYGKYVRMISAIACIAISIGAIALQLKVISSLFNHFFGFSSIYAVLLSSFIVIVYSTFGGIKSVIFTDTIQFFTFGAFVPIFALFVWEVLGDHQLIIENVVNSPLFDFRELTNYNNPRFFPYFTLFFYSALATTVDPSLFQRALLAKDTKQISKSFIIAAFVGLFVLIMACAIGAIMYGYNQKLDPNNLVMHIIDNYSYPGLKGFVLVGILAITMSTADSWINLSAVIFSYDLCKPLGIEFRKDELLLSRLFSIFIGFFAIILALTTNNLLDLLLLIGNFFCPIVVPILFLAILGFRSTAKVALVAIGCGILTTIAWRVYLQSLINIDSVIPGTIANLLAFLFAHYLLGEPGGWVKSRKNRSLQNTSSNKQQQNNEAFLKFFYNFPQKVQNFSFLEYFNKNALKHEITYIYFGIFTTLSMLCTTILLDQSIYQQRIFYINIMQIIILALSTSLITCKLWSQALKEKYLALIWYMAIFISLSVSGSFLILINTFSPLSLMLFSINLLIISSLLKWQETIIMLVGGMVVAYIPYYFYADTSSFYLKFYDLKFTIIYSLLMLTGSLIFFLKPKQEYQELTEEKNEHLHSRISIQEKQAQEALALKGEFIRNVSHEYHAPMTGIVSMAETLYAGYKSLNDEQVLSGLETIYQSTLRLKSFDDNISTLSLLSKPNYALNKEELDLSDLVYRQAELCRKLYEENKETREFILDIDEGIIFNGDKNYLTQVFDNLIINTINYCKQGRITITLKQAALAIEFTITDEGIGIPPEELYDVFDPFVSSKTRTPAGGRGVGLALCKRVIEVHGGEIKAESDGVKGATFRFVLPFLKN